MWAPACVLSVVFVGMLLSGARDPALEAGVVSRANFRPAPTSARMSSVRTAAMRTSTGPNVLANLKAGAATLGLFGAMSMGVPIPSVANEFDVLDAAKPTSGYIMDDAPCIMRGSEKKINEALAYLDVGKGFKLNVVTVRKLEDSPDADTLAEKMLEKWSANDKSNSAVLTLVVKNSEVGFAAGENFIKALGEDNAGSITQSTVGYFASEGRPNQGVSEGVRRINAILNGEADPGPPEIKEERRERTYKTKEEVDRSKGASIQVVGALLLIAFVVPMLQYAGYVQKE